MSALWKLQRRCIWNSNNSKYFKRLHDTRIVPDFIFGCTTVIFSITTLNWAYVGYTYAMHHATDFNAHCDRVIGVLDNKADKPSTTIHIKLNNNNPIEIVCNDHNKNTHFTNDLVHLFQTKFADQNIQCVIRNDAS
eukprot:687926_1